MSGNKEGAAKAKQTVLERYGVDENGKSIHHRKAGLKGGGTKPSSPRGFAKHPEIARKAGKKGGKQPKTYKNIE